MAMIVLRVSDELKADIVEAANRSGWTISAQVRYELLERRGLAKQPYLPTPPTEPLDA